MTIDDRTVQNIAYGIEKVAKQIERFVDISKEMQELQLKLAKGTVLLQKQQMMILLEQQDKEITKDIEDYLKE